MEKKEVIPRRLKNVKELTWSPMSCFGRALFITATLLVNHASHPDLKSIAYAEDLGEVLPFAMRQ